MDDPVITPRTAALRLLRKHHIFGFPEAKENTGPEAPTPRVVFPGAEEDGETYWLVEIRRGRFTQPARGALWVL